MIGNSFSNNGSSLAGIAGIHPLLWPLVVPLPLVAVLREPVPHGAAWMR